MAKLFQLAMLTVAFIMLMEESSAAPRDVDPDVLLETLFADEGKSCTGLDEDDTKNCVENEIAFIAENEKNLKNCRDSATPEQTKEHFCEHNYDICDKEIREEFL